MEETLRKAAGADRVWFTDASRLALQLMGDAINANLFLLGFAWQHGLVPVSRGAITRAIELNGVAVEQNLKAFEWGRHAAHDAAGVERLATPAAVIPFEAPVSRTLDELIARRIDSLTDYQDAAYAARYRKLVDRVREIEAQRVPGTAALAEAVARYYYKLLAIKDEYEVARLYTRPEFRQRLEAAFEGDFTLKFHLAPPLLAKPDPVTGVAQKREYGPWMMKAFGWLAKFKGLRGTALDVFGRTEERRMERQLIVDYEKAVDELLAALDRGNHATAVAIASIPEEIRGYGHVKLRHLKAAKAKEAELLAAFRSPASSARAA
jgi:indolepyruvate ferredoxin oxidoreductase